MLPNYISAEEVENLPEEWYCKDNIYDPDRSHCDAEEKEGPWMVRFFAACRTREEAGLHSQSQVSKDEKGGTDTIPIVDQSATDMIPAVDQRHHEYTVRDEVLGALVERYEERTSATTSSGKMRWVSKWDFYFGKTEQLELAQKEEIVRSPIKNSPFKTKTLTTKSKTEESANEKDASRSMLSSPQKKICRSLRSNTNSSDKSVASPPSDRKLRPRQTRSSVKSSNKSRDAQPPDKSPKKKRFKPHKRGSSGKKQKSLEKSATKAKTGSRPPMEEATNKAIVDLTFSGSDSD